MACCGTNTWTATKGSLTVFINGKGAHRMGDQNRHCGGVGQLVEGSPNVIVGESGGSGGGGWKPSAGTGRGSHSGGEPPGGTSGRSGTRDGHRDDPGHSGGVSAASGADGAGPGSGTGDRRDRRSNAAIEPDAIEIVVVNVRGDPVGNVEFELVFPDRSKRIGRTASDGSIRFENLPQRGECTLTFPDLEQLPGGHDG